MRNVTRRFNKQIGKSPAKDYMKACIKDTCKHKGELQPVSNFYKNERASDGYRVYCKDCELERGKKRYNDIKGDWTKMIIG